jgi:baseplate J-like protein
MQMQEKDAPVSHVQHTPLDPHSEPVMPLADAKDDDPEEIFLRAVADIDTQPLPPRQEICWPLVIVTLLFFFSFVGGSIIALLTYPTVTIEVVPVTKQVSLTAPLALPTRALAPVTLTRSLTIHTTGKGHQDARNAAGTLTFYNGQAAAQTIPGGTGLTGQDGIKISTDRAVTIPPGIPPTYGQVSVSARALVPGSAGNIAAGDINTTVALAVFVKNSAFSGGQNQRDYPAVTQRDQDRLTVQLRNTSTQAIPQAFPLAVGEQVFPTDCTFKVSPNHRVGAEATALTITASEICSGIAYNSQQLIKRATTLFTQQATPGTHYQLVDEVQVRVIGVSPLTVSCRGLWAYALPQDYEQFLAEQIAGDSPQQAQKYLLQTGFLTRATVPEKLPPDPAHIHFQVYIGI